MLADIDNDGRALEIVAQQNGTPQAWFEVRDGAWVKHVVSDRTYGHGIGVGDVNGDGRNDILTPRGWLEAPADPRTGPLDVSRRLGIHQRAARACAARASPQRRRRPPQGSHPPLRAW